MMTVLFNLFLLLPSNSHADVRAVMEGVKTSNNTVFIDTVNARVGISTAAPSRALHVFGPTDAVPVRFTIPTATTNGILRLLELENRTTGTSADGFGSGILFNISDAGASSQGLGTIAAVRAGAVNTGDIVLRPSASGTENERLRITSSGRLGVGTASPSTVLDINGASQFGSGATKSTITAAGAVNLASGAALTASGANGNIISASSITTTGGVFGNGSGLTNLPAVTLPTRQIFTSGSGATYTTPANVRQLRIRMIGGGGGGGAAATNAGADGGASMFFTVVASSGIGGPAYNAGTGKGGPGGSGGAGAASFRIPGGGGGAPGAQTLVGSGVGGSSAFGGGGAGITTGSGGTAGGTNSGGGGGGGFSGAPDGGGAGGGAGEYVELIINSPAATYLYTVGAGGAGGAAGVQAGGAGAAGIIVVDEIY